MARHRHAVIWTRISGQPQKMGDLVLSDAQTSFTYNDDYLAGGGPGFCLLGDGAIWGRDTVTYPVSERISVFPRLLSLIPGSNPRNLQRRHYLDLLRSQLGREPSPGPDTEWQLLQMGGHGGIGHIDVFADDIAAVDWYEGRAAPAAEGSAAADRSQLWRMLKNNVLDENVEFDPLLVEAALGPTPSVGGMIPKLLVSLSPDEKQAGFFPPESPGKQPVVLKVEPPEYRGLLDLEALCLDVHRDAGFVVPQYRRYDADGLNFLAVERFDRDTDGLPVPMESLFSVIASGDHRFRETGDILLDELGGILTRLQDVAELARDTGELLYKRILMALLTGNGDLHLDNLALLGGLDDCRLAPVYDPAPMRAWPRHNLVSAIPFDPAPHPDHGEYFAGLGRSFGLTKARAGRCIEAALAATSDYPGQVMALEQVPEIQRSQLAGIARRERTVLEPHA